MKNKNTDVSNTPVLNNIICRNCDWRNGGENNYGTFVASLKLERVDGSCCLESSITCCVLGLYT